jgi:hypothetical protein
MSVKSFGTAKTHEITITTQKATYLKALNKKSLIKLV